MKYKIEVHSLGYEDTTLIVDAPSLKIAKQSERAAKIQWCEHNDIDLDGNFEMPFTRVSRIPESKIVVGDTTDSTLISILEKL